MLLGDDVRGVVHVHTMCSRECSRKCNRLLLVERNSIFLVNILALNVNPISIIGVDLCQVFRRLEAANGWIDSRKHVLETGVINVLEVNLCAEEYVFLRSVSTSDVSLFLRFFVFFLDENCLVKRLLIAFF